MNDRLRESLDAELAKLPRDIAPPRNLWPGVRARLHRRQRLLRPMPFAAAAGITGACLASALTWAILHDRPQLPAPQPVARGGTSVAGAASFDEPRTPKYVAARDNLEATFRERLALLDPKSRSASRSSAARMRTSARRSPATLRARCSSNFGRVPGTTNSTCMTTSYGQLNPR
jgi:hypothetical protein